MSADDHQTRLADAVSLRPERLISLGAIKPGLTGSLWALGEDNSPEWGCESIAFVKALCQRISLQARALADKFALPSATSSGRSGTLPSRIEELRLIAPTVCLQRVFDTDERRFDYFRPLDALASGSDIARGAPVVYAGFAFKVRTQPQWADRNLGLTGARWDLVLVAIALPFVLVGVCGTRAQQILVDDLNLHLAKAFPGYILQPPEQLLLDEAFIGARTRQTNLRGLHRSAVERPDRKSLYGTDLRFAIDPYGDHTFAYSYGRGTLRLNAVREAADDPRLVADLIEDAFPNHTERTPASIGYNAPEHAITAGPTKGIVQHARRLDLLRLLLVETDRRLAVRTNPDAPVWGDQLGLAYLSGRIPSERVSEVFAPFEAQIALRVAPDAAFGAPDRARRAVETWEEAGSLEPMAIRHNRDGTLSITVRALWAGRKIAIFRVLVRPVSEKIEMRAKIIASSVENDGEREALRALGEVVDQSEDSALDVKFESGHTLSAGRLFKPTLREHLFRDFVPFSSRMKGRSYDITREKPKDWRFRETRGVVGLVETSDSLFSQLSLNPDTFFGLDPASTDWALVNNDQPGEIADFILVDAPARRLAFVHTKGADSDKPDRRIAIGPYEACVPQAIKNLRHVSLDHLAVRLREMMRRAGTIGTYAVRSDGSRPVVSQDTAQAYALFERLVAAGLPEKVEVICHVPHVSTAVWARETSETPSRASRMLSMLLLDAKARAANLNAEFKVWIDGDTDSADDLAGVAE